MSWVLPGNGEKLAAWLAGGSFAQSGRGMSVVANLFEAGKMLGAEVHLR